MIGKRTDSALCNSPDDHTQLTMYYIRQFLNDIINISFRFSQLLYEVYWLQYKLYWCSMFLFGLVSYFMKCFGYNTNCIGAITKSNQMGTNTLSIVANTLCNFD